MCLSDFVYDVDDRLSVAGIELGGRLIDQQKIGLRCDSPCQHEPLRLPSRELPELPMGNVVQSETVQKLLRRSVSFVRGPRLCQ
ncbi:hypothetical protein BHD05_03645 [Marisediminicola antarctica]|uniref:Uncharacterized protein n=1 Tax=Marisediminicola antarctica TaxID=674079 RepID=A0A7L5AFC5_9MICO|nr:hypothetical protein BHD05_03645 [Marisediminicola antarctica]